MIDNIEDHYESFILSTKVSRRLNIRKESQYQVQIFSRNFDLKDKLC